MFWLIEKAFVILLSFSGSLTNMINASNFIKCISLNNQSCMNRPTLIDLNPDEYNQGFCYYPFIVNLERCNGRCNTLDDP